MSELTPNELKLAAALLDIASNEFGNHTCGDFSLMEHEIPKPARRALLEAMEDWNGSDAEEKQDAIENSERDGFDYTSDWYLMSFLAARLRGEA